MKLIHLIAFAAIFTASILGANAQTPGNVNASNITPIAWFTPDGYAGGVWTNRITTGGVGDFTQLSAWTKTPPSVTTGQNFHQAVMFRPAAETEAKNRMVSTNTIDVDSTESFTVITVYKRTPGDTWKYSNILNYSINGEYAYNTITYGTADMLYVGWGYNPDKYEAEMAGNHQLGSAPAITSTLLTIDNNNVSSTRWYLDGKYRGNTSSPKHKTNNYTLVIGGSHEEMTSGDGSHSFKGDVQELIILKRNRYSSPFLDQTEFNKIHSYLAVKYGITLGKGNYLASDETVVWDSTANAGYNDLVFGLGRDDDYSLNQKQATSEKDIFSVYIGDYITPLNSGNIATFDNDKTYALFGTSSSAPSIEPYPHSVNKFLNGGAFSAHDTVNYRAGRVHKVQFTGVNPLSVNLEMKNILYTYCLVSTNENFTEGTTRIYKINDNKVTIDLTDKYQFIDFAGFEYMPGNVTGVTAIAWLTPDGYGNGVWVNRIVNSGTAGDFKLRTSGGVAGTVYTPPAQAAGFNYHEGALFATPTSSTNGQSSPNAMISTETVTTAGKNTTFIAVFQRTDKTAYDVMIGFTEGANGSSKSLGVLFYDDSKLLMRWNNDQTGGTEASTINKGILMMDNGNYGTGNNVRINSNLSNTNTPYARGTAASGNANFTNKRIELAADGAGNFGFDGIIQEVIILSAGASSAGNTYFTDNVSNWYKLSSYLAVKYGITFKGNYLASDGSTTVWDHSSAPTGYSDNIFGLGRDDNYRLYQRQATSENSIFNVYIGSSLAKFNSGNTATFANDKTYALFGTSNSTPRAVQYPYSGAGFYNGSTLSAADTMNYRANRVHKVQLTGASELSVNIEMKKVQYKYCIVSTTADFIQGSTRIYKANGGKITIKLTDPTSFIDFADFERMPGNINSTGITPVAWLTPDGYSNGVWTNRLVSGESVGDFKLRTSGGVTGTVYKPATQAAGFNYYEGALFATPSANSGQSSPNAMLSTETWTANDKNVTFIAVFQRSDETKYDALVGFAEGPASANGVLFYDTGNDLYTRWNESTTYKLISLNKGVLMMDLSNNTTSSTNSLLINSNLSSANTLFSIPGGTIDQFKNKRIELAADGYGTYGFDGVIQEVIIFSAGAKGSFFTDNAANWQQIRSYLAIKYGITLSDINYLASNGTTEVWNRNTNYGYNNNIFGIGRDNNYSLYQKQSRNTDYPFLTAFVGNEVATLNSANGSGQLDEGVYAMLGSNGGNLNLIMPIADVPVVGSSLKANYYRNLVYKVQLTGVSSMKIKLKINPSIISIYPEYMLVSTDANFAENATQAYQFNSSTTEIEVTDGCYIAFGGRRIGANEGPGGIIDGLMLWLRADKESTVTTELLAKTDDKLNYYRPGTIPDGTLTPGVSAWTDPIRNRTYSYGAALRETKTHQEPVYEPGNIMTNFHPTVRFWAHTSDYYTAYLTDTVGIWPTKYATDDKHSAFFVVNNNFGSNPWVYTMMFGQRYPTTDNSGYEGPGYGVEKSGSKVVGRFRTSASAANGAVDLFKPGATSILGYHQNADTIQWRFNGLEDRATFSKGDFDLSKPSIIGTGWQYLRTIIGVMSEIIMYDGELPAESQHKVESYLALKYGITLAPSNQQNNRFDYIFSDGMTLWNGTAGSGTVWDKYYNRIAAVIRDDAADLSNRQSHSTNVGSILHMGIAGTKLGSQPNLGNFEYDTEAVIWGDNNEKGTTENSSPTTCRDYGRIFNRTWLVHKRTENNRPVEMIIGAENNAANQLGDGDTDTKEMFDVLTSKYKVYMLVADSVEKLTPGNPKYGQFSAVIPMQYLDGEQQCIYTFSDTITYITFGYTQINTTCTEIAPFDGTKTFYWTQWPQKNYGTTVNATQAGYNLGDNVVVTSTIQYGAGISPATYYPSVTNTVTSGSLYLKRRYGAIGSAVTVTLDMNTSVRPEFSVFDIDGYAGRFEKITVKGYCNDDLIDPTLSYAGNPASAYYRITGNAAAAVVRRDLSPSNSNGRLNVAFEEGVTKIVIEFTMVGSNPGSTTHNLIVSPVRFRQIPPPPPINEDDLSLTKDVAERAITICDPVDYSFYIGNMNCEPKYVNFSDTLETGLIWMDNAGIDASNGNNPSLKFNDYAGTRILQIDSLLIPGSSTVRLTASAIFEDEAVADGVVRQFNNHAWIKYEKIMNSTPTGRSLKSVDRDTHSPETWFNATGRVQQDSVKTSIATDVSQYSADKTITAVITINNSDNNSVIMDSYLDVSYDAGFSYVAGSFVADFADGDMTTPTMTVDTGQLSTDDFVIPTGTSTFTFKLKAPEFADLENELDEHDVPTGRIMPLNIVYAFSTETNSPCLVLGMADAFGSLEIPYNPLYINDDYGATTIPNPIKIAVLENDSIPETCTNPDPKVILSHPSRGSASIVNDTLVYTPTGDYFGLDTVVYEITCGNDTATANVYIQICTPHSVQLCITSTSRTVIVNVLKNDTDSLINAEFVHAADTVMADIMVSDSTVSLTVKPNAYIGAGGHVFEIVYSMKDNGLPASQCATRILNVNAYSTPNYPDIRVRVCPDPNKSINLSKYHDTTFLTSIAWESVSHNIPIDVGSGTISTGDLKAPTVYTFTYTVDHLCIAGVKRKVYLETLKEPAKMRPPKESILICYRYAEALQINQLFGIEADGTWTFEIEDNGLPPQYITTSNSATFGGAIIMDGKAIYKDFAPGGTPIQVKITYKPANGSCLDKPYSMVIILTDDMT